MLTAQGVDWQGKMLGRYRLKRLLGRGGMGEVWQAEDTELDRQIAIKLLTPVLRHEKEYLDAFAAEARLAAALEHPHILPVHDFGEFSSGDDVITYLISPLVDGGSLRDHLKKRKEILPVTVALNYLRQAAEAIDYAHSKHILHRDIKPGNMLLQENWLFLSDFGLAKLLTTHTYRSRTHAGAGTPGYIAPEQIRGRAEPASDLYSLAVVAYQLLTGHLPFLDDDPFGVFLKHLNETPPPPRQYNPSLPEAMEQTILQGLAKLPAERHSSCLAFVSELEHNWQAHGQALDPETTLIAPWNKRVLANLPTQQMDNTASEQSSQTITPITVSDEVTYIQHPSSTTPTGIENKKEERQEATTQKIVGRRGFLAGGAAAALFLAGGGLAASTLYQLAQKPGPKKMSTGVPVLKLTGHTEEVYNVRWNPQGRYLASCGVDANVLIWDIDNLIPSSTKQIRTASQPSTLWKPDTKYESSYLIDWSPDGHTLAMVSDKDTWGGTNTAIETVDIFAPHPRPDWYLGNKMLPITINTIIQCLAWSPKGDLIATSHTNSSINPSEVKVILWHAHQPTQQVTILNDATTRPQDAYYPYMRSLCWSADGAWVIGVDTVFKVHLWNVAVPTQPQSFTLPNRLTAYPQAKIFRFSIAASPANSTRIAVSDGDVAVIYDIQQKKNLRLLGSDDPEARQALAGPGTSQYYSQVNPLVWSPDGRYLAGSYLSAKKIFIWDLQNSNPRMKDGVQMPDFVFGQKNGHSDLIMDLSWSPDGRYLASSSFDSTVIIWQVDAA
ncbi:hypothetical protein KSF_080750 [Reticulibacter mediterranei]|uniref:non-specific serine/threonine protein kinase n=2 Tax=Reticulibacter mediterranei TaxID=2778369 RepID=A0A8J3N895_9CHLR|nr:hypothetical protein KSF_080750 [Reticulibacter mediterranei]